MKNADLCVLGATLVALGMLIYYDLLMKIVKSPMQPVAATKTVPSPKPELSCMWSNHPDDTWKDRWVCITGEGEIIGTVCRYTNRYTGKSDPVWHAFVGQRFCRSGELMSKEAAIACVDEELKKR
jgi:hypothetical protein